MIAAWQASPQYKIHIAMLDSLEKVQEAEQLAKMDIVDKLYAHIQKSRDTTEEVQLYGVLIDTLEHRFKVDTTYRKALSKAYWGKGFFELSSKDFNKCEATAHTGLKIITDESRIKSLLGHALLFQGKYEEAVKIYQDYLDDEQQDTNRMNADIILAELKKLDEAGVIPTERAKDVAAIRKLLQKID